MPNTEDCKRALRKMERRRARNRVMRSSLRTMTKKYRLTVVAVAGGAAADPADLELRNAIKRIDQACAKGLIHKNKASRDKSRLTLALNKARSATKSA